MLTFRGQPHRFCDGISRRNFLKIGALGVGGALNLPELLNLRARAGSAAKPRAVIMVCLAGGPSHLEMYDLKPDATVDYRGEFKPIRTNVPGMDISELFSLQATIADKLALVRTVQFVEPMQHELPEVYTGFPKAAGRPSFGAVISRFRGDAVRGLPRYVSLEYNSGASREHESARYLGAEHEPFHPFGGQGMRNLSLSRGMTLARLDERRELQKSLDTLRRDLDTRDRFAGIDKFTAQAVDMITSAKARDAFDLSREPDRVRERYGPKDAKYRYVSKASTSPWPTQEFLLARRLVEAGVPVVTLRVGSWDHHGNVVSTVGSNIWDELRTSLPLLDRSIHALVTDLHERGLDKEVAVLVWGEFGRTPKISQGGRDHWPDVGFALFAGAVKTGLVIGETDSRGARPKSRGVGAQNVIGTLYHLLGINPKQTVPDFSGRPQYLLEDGEPISELV